MASSQARILQIVWFSRTGASRQLAEAAAAAAREQVQADASAVRIDGCAAAGAAVAIRCDGAAEATTEAMLMASAYLFVAPENLASLAGAMKEFFDHNYYPLLGRIEGRAAAVIIAAGSDGHGALRQTERILTGWRLRLVAESLIVRIDAQTSAAILAAKQLSAAQLQPARDLGQALAAGLAIGIF